MSAKNKDLDIVHNFKSNSSNSNDSNSIGNLIDETLNAQDEHTTYLRRSYMYEFIFMFIIAIIVLVITIRNLTSDSVTTAGSVICWIILILFVISIIMYIARLIGDISIPDNNYNSHSNRRDDSGPVIRIHYV